MMMAVDFGPIATAAGTLRLAASASLATAIQSRGSGCPRKLPVKVSTAWYFVRKFRLHLDSLLYFTTPYVHSLGFFFTIDLLALHFIATLFSHNMTSLCWLQQFPAALDVLLAEPCYYALSNFIKVARGQRQDCWPGSRQTHAQQARLRTRCH